jgi:hypothetical protein
MRLELGLVSWNVGGGLVVSSLLVSCTDWSCSTSLVLLLLYELKRVMVRDLPVLFWIRHLLHLVDHLRTTLLAQVAL